MTAERTPADPVVTADRARLSVAYSRAFSICVACPHGSHLPGMGTRAVAWFDQPEVGGRYGLCAAHSEEWSHDR